MQLQGSKIVPPSYADINREKKRHQIAFRRFMFNKAPAKELAPYIGCDIFALRAHLSGRMAEGITWSNYGEWVIDHIVPLRLFNIFCPEELALVWNYRNLMPLMKADNLHKEGDLRFSLLLLHKHNDGSEIYTRLIERAQRELERMDKYLREDRTKLAIAS